MTTWITASQRRNSLSFLPKRVPLMSYKSFRRIIDSSTIRRDYLKDDWEYHGSPMVALSRSIKIVVQPDEGRAFYYRDRPFMTIAGYNAFLSIDVSRFPRPKSVLKAARKVLAALPTNIEIGEFEGGECLVKTRAPDQDIKWQPLRLSLTFHEFASRPQGPNRRFNFEHDPTRYYTPDEKEIWAWHQSKSSSPDSVAIMEANSRRAAKLASSFHQSCRTGK